jgi:hypothetical protein
VFDAELLFCVKYKTDELAKEGNDGLREGMTP